MAWIQHVWMVLICTFLLTSCGFCPVFKGMDGSQIQIKQGGHTRAYVTADKSLDHGTLHRFRLHLHQQMQAFAIVLPYPTHIHLESVKQMVGFQEDASVSRVRRSLSACIRMQTWQGSCERHVDAVTSFDQKPFDGLTNWLGDQMAEERLAQALVWEVMRNLGDMLHEVPKKP
jgi:hypothetical protein